MIMEFDNSRKFTLLEHDGRAYYIKISRYTRTEPFFGMKQPTPHGGTLGVGCMLLIKYNGLPVERKWRLYEEGEVIAEGITDKNGKSYELPVAMHYLGVKNYGFEMVAPTAETDQET
jgi:hypothetical protein